MISSIQFLRAVAALMVVWFHAEFLANAYGGYRFDFGNAGAAGVDVFFVISGFIITYVTHGRGVSPRDFLVRRLIRIAPPYWFYTSITVGILLALPSAFTHLRFDTGHVLMSYLFMLSQNNANSVGTVLGVGWSVCFEAYFYVLFAAVIVLPRPLATLWISGVLIVGALLENLVAAPPFSFVALSALPLEFLAGHFLASLYLRGIRLPRLLAYFALGVGFALIGVAGEANVVANNFDPWRVVHFGLPAICLTAGFLSLDGPGGILFPALALAIGDASYSLYLSHQFVQFAIGKAWTFLGLHERLPAIALLVVALVLPVAAGMLAFRWMERPITRWLNEAWKSRAAAT